MRLFSMIMGQILAALALSGPPVMAAPPSCVQWLVVQGRLEATHHENEFYIEDTDYGFAFLARLDHGNLELALELADPKTGMRSSMRGSQIYPLMLDHIGRDRIRVIQGSWLSGTNYDAYREQRGRGIDPKTAAKNTWSGRQAALYGFSEVGSVIDNPMGHTDQGVFVEFVRPLKTVKGEYFYDRFPTVFAMTDVTNGFHFRGTLMHGVLDISVELTNARKGIRSELRGQDLYRQMMAHFQAETIQTVHGIWSSGVNFQTYFAARRRGLDPKEAAVLTWSARQAAQFGFTRVAKVEERKLADGRDYVLVDFTR